MSREASPAATAWPSARPRLGWPRPLSIRWRLTIWYTSVLAITLAVFSLLVYWYMGMLLMADIDRDSDERSRQVADMLVRRYIETSPQASFLLRELGLLQESVDPFSDPGVGVRVYDARGILVEGSSDILLDPQRVPDDRVFIMEAHHGRVYRNILTTTRGTFYAYSRPVFLQNGQLWAVIQILTSLTSYHNTMALLARLLAGGTLLASAVAAVSGAAMAHTALAPISAITQTAQQINRTSDLERRIRVDGPADEVGRLAATVNEMLERIQKMFEQQRQFLADVSHELRTPLTTIRGELGIMQRTRTIDPEGLAAMSDEAERMSRMISDLLFLARSDAEQLELAKKPVEVDTLLLEVFRQLRALAADGRSVALGHEDAATVLGDRDHLKQLLLNLGANALTHTPAGTHVTLSLINDGQSARLVVADDGPGIAASDQEHLFDRFYRADRSRSRAGGGTGLGLAIAQRIAVAHGGDIQVTSHPGEGTTFTVRLPLAAESTARHHA